MWLLVAGVLLSSSPALAVSPDQILVGESVDQAWVEREASPVDGMKPVLGATSSNTSFLLYQTKDEQLRLSAFADGKEHSLWNFKDGDAVMSGLVPQPRLFVCDLDGNDLPDVILVYAENMAGGQVTEVWEQRMMIFLDGKAQNAKTLSLAGRDLSYSEDGNQIRSAMDAENPGAFTTAFVLVYPAAGDRGMVVVWHWERQIASTAELRVSDQHGEPRLEATMRRYEFRDGKIESMPQRQSTVSDFIHKMPPDRVGLVIN